LQPKEALDALTSFAISEEGTNTLYLGLVEVVAQRDHFEEPYSLQECEMTLNYFPHHVWQETQQNSTNANIESMRDRFYGPILEMVQTQWVYMPNEQFLAIF